MVIFWWLVCFIIIFRNWREKLGENIESWRKDIFYEIRFRGEILVRKIM